VDAPRADPLVVTLDRFQGPLDLLLHLIRQQDLDIFDIPISRITEQFLAAVRGLDRLELERAGEFLEMAATLVRIKAQLLFPRRSEEEEEDPRADLVRRLLEYEHFREAARLLEEAERERSRYRARVRAAAPGARAGRGAPGDALAGGLGGGARAGAAARRAGARLPRRRPAGPDGGEDRPRAPGAGREREGRVPRARRALGHANARGDVAARLPRALEAAPARLRQGEPFAPLWVYRRRAEADAA
jgi:hypothetical protein